MDSRTVGLISLYRNCTNSQDRDILPPQGDKRGISISLDKEKSLSPGDQPDISSNRGLTLSSSIISWVLFLQIFFIFTIGTIVGKLYSTFGTRYLIIGETIFHVFGLIMISISNQYYQLLLSQGICTLSTVSAWFNRKQGITFATLLTGSSIGGVIFSIINDCLIAEVGFGWSMRISIFIILFLLGIAIVTVKTQYFYQQSPKSSSIQLIQLFKEPIIFIPINYIIVQAVVSRISTDLVLYLVPILNTASLFGCLGAGFISDRYGRYNIFIAIYIVAGVLVLAFWIPAIFKISIIVFVILFSFVSGAYIKIGYCTGLLFLFVSVNRLITSPITGAILQYAGGDYTYIKIFSGVILLGETAFIITARVVGTGLKLIVKY
ncbi:major facilitator superfamily domain-containing protein [Aspergillus pseudocaelatus]|uniref:Major facilitator superfamily domain-containing protein n=1 Tax=Aspergillus pseudocaelatus TaxID=1825620 RepID=A0ABQ6W0G2_9EURO|nr:major facilitator superfamily domain-containing protein [Aspergillus pseudocaelatus]